MKDNHLLRINLNITVILVIGFALTAVLSYRANYQASLDNIEQVSSLTAEGIYYRLTTRFTKPVNISLTMAHDNLLVRHLTGEARHPEDRRTSKPPGNIWTPTGKNMVLIRSFWFPRPRDAITISRASTVS